MLSRKILFPVFAVAVLLAATVPAWAEPLACKGQGGVKELPYESMVPAGYDHDRFATQPRSLMFSYGSFTSSFETHEDHKADSPYKGIPKWVSYEMHGLMGADGPIHPQGAKRPVKWYELEATDFLWTEPRLKPGIDTSYRGFAVLWNRGHMAARSHANRISWQEGCNTHTFVNALPQFADMNQGDWLALENYAVAAANKFGKVWTIAGPVFEPEREVDTIGKDGVTVPVAIPHALFKILVIERKGKVEARAFLFHQADEDQRGSYRKCAGTPQSKYDLATYSTSLSALEKATGLQFLTRLSDTERKTVDAASAKEPWPIEGKYWDDRCGGDDDDDV